MNKKKKYNVTKTYRIYARDTYMNGRYSKRDIYDRELVNICIATIKISYIINLTISALCYIHTHAPLQKRDVTTRKYKHTQIQTTCNRV